jgi:hypothetical protein
MSAAPPRGRGREARRSDREPARDRDCNIGRRSRGRRLSKPRRLARPFTDLTARDYAPVPRQFVLATTAHKGHTLRHHRSDLQSVGRWVRPWSGLGRRSTRIHPARVLLFCPSTDAWARAPSRHRSFGGNDADRLRSIRGRSGPSRSQSGIPVEIGSCRRRSH